LPGLLIAALLLSSLLLVHASMAREPLRAERPLDVDRGLPLPEVGQASSVFSLTALFGAYFGIYLLLGLAALAGLAVGTVAGLALVRHWLTKSKALSFELYLEQLFAGSKENVALFGMALILTQCAYASSELLIVRELARSILGLRMEHATLVALGLAIVGYFYILLGGYLALFRTDVLQFTLMALVLFVGAISAGQHAIGQIGFAPILAARDGYWLLPGGWSAPSVVLGAYHFAVAFVMGVGFISASPDAWKRVFLVERTLRPRRRFLSLVAAGTLPFLLLVPLASQLAIPDGPTNQRQLFAALFASNAVFISASLGLVASFLSSFNSSVLTAVHLGLVIQRTENPLPIELSRFHWLMAIALVGCCLLFLGLVAFGNSYLLANVLLGPFALITGIQLAGNGKLVKYLPGTLLWISVACMLTWIVYLTRTGTSISTPSTYQVNSVPAAVGLTLVVSIAAWFAQRRSTENV